MTNVLETLALRCSPIGGPVTESLRTIDVAIWTALHGDEQYKSVISFHGDYAVRYYPGPPEAEYTKLPRYTTSLDAAVSLIPTGHDWILEHVNGGLTIGCRVGHNDPDRTSWGDTAALAICAAALRARAAK